MDRIGHPKKRAFLTAYRNTGNIRAACEAAEVARSQFYVWQEHDEVFAAAAEQAKQEFGDLLEAKLSQMAMKQDNVTALIVALKMAGRFVERTRSELSGPDGKPIQFETANEIDAAISRRLEAMAARGEGEVPLAVGRASESNNTSG